MHRKFMLYFFSFVRMAGLIVLAISLTALSGHISNHPYLYMWSKGAGMGLNTSICFAFIGVSLIVLSNSAQRKNGIT